MATKRKPAERAPWEVDFVHIDLSTADKEALQKWDRAFDATSQCLSSLCVDGWKLTAVFDGRNDCCICSVTSPKVEAGGHQKCLSARGPDLWSALRSMAYKVTVILDGDMTQLTDVAETRSQWG